MWVLECIIIWGGRQQINLSYGLLRPSFKCFYTLHLQLRDRKNYSILKKPSGEHKSAAENLYVHCLSVLTRVGLVSGRTSSKPAPESYFITSCIRDDITKGLDQKATLHSLNHYDKSKYSQC